jgi:hypothetical protein
VSDLADRVARLPAFEQESGGDTYGPCPLYCGSIVHVTNEGAVWCDGGCRPKDVRTALDLRVGTVQPCPRAKDSRHRWEGFCPTCNLYEQATRRLNSAELDRIEEERSNIAASSMRVSGGYLFDLPADAPIWGTRRDVLSAEGQGWMICGPDGRGKTSVAAQYAKARLGLASEMWDLPVKALPEDRSVYYLAADRPRQMMEAFMRGVGPSLREVLDRRLFVHRGPSPYRLSRDSGQSWLLREIEETRAGLVVFDARKDIGNTLDGEDVTGVARMIQLLVASDVEVLVLAHPHKRRRNGPPTLEDVSGFSGVYNGLGSVLFLDSRKAGDALVEVHHVKPIREPLPMFRVLHDHSTGCSARAPVGIVPGEKSGDLHEGQMPVDRWQVRVLACIDAHPGEWCPAKALKDLLNTDNLHRDLRGLIAAEVIESNGKRAAQSAYRRGPKALPASPTSDQ